MNYELQEALRLLRTAIIGNPWTGKLDKDEVQRAAKRLTEIAERLERENTELRRRR